MKKIIQDKQLLIRRIFLMCYDVLAVFAASIVALLIRFDLNIKSVPFQYMDKTFKPCVGLKMGTIFPELVSPYVPCQSMEEINFIRESNEIGKGCNKCQ